MLFFLFKIDTKRKTAAEIGATLGHKDVNSLKIKTEPQKVYTTADIGLEKQGDNNYCDCHSLFLPKMELN